MTSRDRILKVINHEEPDRIPRDLGGTESSGMMAYSQFHLQRHLQIRRDLGVFQPYQYVAYIGNDLRAKFKIDTANLRPKSGTWVRRTNPLGFDGNQYRPRANQAETENCTQV